MSNSGLIFKIRCQNFVSKLNLDQLKVLKVLVNDKIVKLNKKGLYKQELNGRKEYIK